MQESMFYTIYKTTNKINGKVYIGSHKTRNLDDSYMGSGKYLLSAIKKHGIENFEKEILYVFDNPEDMYAKEAELVNEEFLAEANTYNLKKGGFGGFDYINSSGINNKNHEDAPKKTSETLKKRYAQDPSLGMNISTRNKEGYKSGKRKVLFTHEFNREMARRAQTDSAKAKRARTRKENNFQQGERNSQYGTKWIYNIVTGEFYKLKKGENLPVGWELGKQPKKPKPKPKTDISVAKKLFREKQKNQYREILDYYRDNDISFRQLSKLFGVGMNMYVMFERYFRDEYFEIVKTKKGNSNKKKGRYD
jgi:hypothetical protein